MVRINIICVSKNKDRWIDESVAHYQKLLKKFARVEFTIIPDIRNARSISEKELIKKEAERIAPHLKSSYKIALSDSGKKYDSIKFADHLQSIMNSYGGSLDFVIGGIYGLDKTILTQCNETLSLSPMTFSHQLVRPVLLEQLYRAFSILSGGKYHK